MLKMINYSFNFEKIIINKALFDQSPSKYLQQKTNSLLGSNFWYLVSICINLIQMTMNCIGQSEYQSYLLTTYLIHCCLVSLNQPTMTYL